MMLFRHEDLEALLAPHEAPCVSIFLPTHRHRPDAEQDRIRLKNLLRSAEALLAEKRRPVDVDALLAPMRALLEQTEFWQHQMDGLALFRSADHFAEYRLPMSLPERVVVADTFHVKPMLRFLQTDRRYLLLTLSRKAVRLYEGTSVGLSPVDLSGVPRSLAEALGVREHPNPLTFHHTGARRPVYHGTGAPEEDAKEDIEKFFRAVDAALWESLREERAPLVLAGVAPYLPLYRAVSRYPYLTDEGLEGNFDDARPDELHAAAWPIVSRIFAADMERALAEYDAAVSRRVATSDLPTIAAAAVQGRVRKLLLAEGGHAWGRLDHLTGDLTLHDRQRDEHDDDVLDDLAEAVLSRGGQVVQLPADQVPGGLAAAILRW